MRCMLVQLTIRRYNYILLIHNMVVNSHLFKQSNEWSTLINPPSELSASASASASQGMEGYVGMLGGRWMVCARM
jgi:hypothetical protein